jgi:hypothetical protein
MTDQIEETSFQVLRKFTRRTKYSMGIFGVVINSLFVDLFFNAPDEIVNAAHHKAGLLALFVGIIAVATYIETEMWLIDKARDLSKKE